MSVLPIVERELRVAARRAATYRGRFYTTFIVAAIGAYLLWVSTMMRSGGIPIFAMATVCLAGVAIAGGWASYDSISREKREGTIGFLFLTDLKGIDIVLGKLAGSALPSIYAAMGVLPVLAIAILMGGVTGRQFWEAALALLNLFFLSHSAAMLGSAMFREQKNAAGFPAFVTLGYIIISIFSEIARDYHRDTAALVFQALNPVHPLFVALQPVAPRGAASYGISLAAVHLTGWLFVGLASWALPRRWQEKQRRPNPLRAWWDQRRFGTTAKRAILRRKLIGTNPFFWLVSRRQSGRVSIWMAFGTFATALAVLATWAIWKGHAPWREIYPQIFTFAVVVFHCALKIMIAGAAGGSLQVQQTNGGLETVLCCTPLTEDEIISGQWLALRRWLLKPALVVIGLGFAMIFAAAISEGRDEDNLQLIWFLLAATLILAPDMIALGWFSMFTAMSQPRTRGSSNAVGAVILVCVVPWIIIGSTYAILDITGAVRNPIAPWIPWVALGSIMDISLCAVLSRQLHKNFRRWAVPTYDPRLTFWGRLGRLLGKAFRKLTSNKLVD